MTKKILNNLPNILILLLALGVLAQNIYTHNYKKAVSVPVRTMDAQYAADFSNDEILVGASHNIFVGKVLEQVGTKERGIGPETQFNVQVVDNIKGDLQGTVVVDQEGGYENGVLYIMGGDGQDSDTLTGSKENTKINSYLLQPGSTYLLATRYNQTENWYTMNPFPTASKLISKDNLAPEQLKTLAVDDPRVKQLEAAYPKEILIDADVKNGKTLNSYKSVQEKSAEQTESASENSSPDTTSDSASDTTPQ